jgi:hypothetical protein
VHLFGRAEDGIYRASLDAQGATYTDCLVNYSYCFGFFLAIFRVEFQNLFAQQVGQCLDTGGAARRTLIDFGFTGCDGLGVWTATWKATLPTLRLRQYLVDLLHHWVGIGTKPPRYPSQAQSEDSSQCTEAEDFPVHLDSA